MTVRIIVGHVIDRLRDLPDNSVHMAVTSPPYWGLRCYDTPPQVWGGDAGCDHRWGDTIPAARSISERGTSSALATMSPRIGAQQDASKIAGKGAWCQQCNAWRGEHGQEPTMALWLANEVAIFAEVRRVLRPDGTLWVNMGDAYATQSNGRSAAAQKAAGGDDRTFRDKPFSTARSGRSANKGNVGADFGGAHRVNGAAYGLPAKNRLMLPARLAIALQDDGWWLRDEIVWAKVNPMPSSVKDRTCPAHEFIHVFSKRPRYYYDHVAIMEPCVSDHASGNGYAREASVSRQNPDGSARGNEDQWDGVGGQRLKRSVWTLAAEPFPDAHFATFPTALIEPCIRAGTSHVGVCPSCAAPWGRIREDTGERREGETYTASGAKDYARAGVQNPSDVKRRTLEAMATVWSETWQPSCKCPAHQPVPATVLDIFGGSGTTGLVADYLGRDAVLIELNPGYAAIADRRIRTALGRVEGEVAPDLTGLGMFDLGRAA